MFAEMKIHILSDLHLEFGKSFDAPSTDADVIVLAGDIHFHTHGLDWAVTQPAFDGKTVIYVLGNNEFYNSELAAMRAEILQTAQGLRALGHRIYVLDCDSKEIAGVRFLGATLWTDFLLFGSVSKFQAMREALRMNDHRLISYASGRGHLDRHSQRSSPFLPEHAERFHVQARAWLADQLTQPFDGKTVVVTHHLPSRRSVPARFEHNLLSAAFASDLDLLAEQADLWIHGHTHDASDYRLGKCRIVCNPRGYPGEPYKGFQADIVVEIR